MTIQALNNLPLDKLIGEPLFAVAKAHMELSKNNIEILQNLSNEPNKTFTFTREEPDSNGTPVTKTIAVTLPMLALIDIPNFTLDQFKNEFTFNVSSIQEDLETKKGTLSGSASAGGLISKFVDFKLEAGYDKTSSSKSTDSENGQLHITVTAKKTGQSVGMKNLMDAATKSITTKEV